MKFFQPIDNDPLTECPRCDSLNFYKTLNKVGVQFKGKGFYSTDSGDK